MRGRRGFGTRDSSIAGGGMDTKGWRGFGGRADPGMTEGTIGEIGRK